MNEADHIARERALKLALGQDPGLHPHLKIRQLSDPVIVGMHVLGQLAERDRRREKGLHGKNLSDSEIYRSALDDFGIDCPHLWKKELVPLPTWGKQMSLFGERAELGRECMHCGTIQVKEG